MISKCILKIQRRFLSEVQFIEKWNQFKHDFVDKFENEFYDDQIIEDIEEVSELVKIQLWDNRIFIINRQTPNREIWLSSPISGPSHFRFDLQTSQWRTKNNKSFYTIFQEDMEKIKIKQFQINEQQK